MLRLRETQHLEGLWFASSKVPSLYVVVWSKRCLLSPLGPGSCPWRERTVCWGARGCRTPPPGSPVVPSGALLGAEHASKHGSATSPGPGCPAFSPALERQVSGCTGLLGSGPCACPGGAPLDPVSPPLFSPATVSGKWAVWIQAEILVCRPLGPLWPLCVPPLL